MRESQLYTLGFAALVCVVCSFMLASASVGLRSRQDKNVELDKQINILGAVDLKVDLNDPDKTQKLYRERFSTIVVNRRGEVLENKTPKDLDSDSEKWKDEFSLYLYRESGETVSAFVLPISGYGLWSTLYGYLAVEADGKTVRGITFYAHKETPGLGARVEEKWFQDQFKGKRLFGDDDQLVSITVQKPMTTIVKANKDHTVYGISGATITSRGVMKLLQKALKRYQAYLKKQWETDG